MARKPPMPQVRWLDMGPWPVFVGYTNDRAAFERELHRLDPENGAAFLGREHADACTHSFHAKGRLTFLIAMTPWRRSITREQYAALLAHEATHVVQVMSEALSHDKPLGSEAEAYLVQQIVQEGLQHAWHSSKIRATKP